MRVSTDGFRRNSLLFFLLFSLSCVRVIYNRSMMIFNPFVVGEGKSFCHLEIATSSFITMEKKILWYFNGCHFCCFAHKSFHY